MSKPWDGLEVGDDILSDVYFGGGHEADFTKALDGGLHQGGIIGTSKGFAGDPYNFTYPTDGQFKLGTHLQCHQQYATSYHFPNASDQRNKETQHYVHPHGSNPDPLAQFEVSGGKLIMKARPATIEDADWATVKGYVQTSTGREATYGQLIAEMGEIPAGWGPTDVALTEGALGHFQNLPADFICPMISTYNRRSMSFGRSACRVKVPVGARARGATTDLRNVDTWFPAIWDLEDVPARCDINGRWHDKDTYTPGNVGAGGVLNELDQGEFFGYSNTQMHVTTHHYEDGGTGYVQNVGGTQVRRTQMVSPVNHTGSGRVDQSTPAYPDLGSLRGQWLEIGVDRYPAGGQQFPHGLIVYWVNGKVVAMYAMPEYMSQPKIIYEPVATVPYIPFMNEDYTVKRLGQQAYEDGQPAYTHWCQIFNIATNASFTRSQAVSALNSDTAPSFNENETMEFEWIIMKPLIDENPDSKPFIDYTAGDFGGSGPAEYVPPVDVDPINPPDPEDDPEVTGDDYLDVQLPVTSPKLKTVTNESSDHVKFTTHDWFTLMSDVEPDVLISQRPGFVFSNGRELRMPKNVLSKKVSDEDSE